MSPGGRWAACQVAASSRQTLFCRERPHSPRAIFHSAGINQTGRRRRRTAVQVVTRMVMQEFSGPLSQCRVPHVKIRWNGIGGGGNRLPRYAGGGMTGHPDFGIPLTDPDDLVDAGRGQVTRAARQCGRDPQQGGVRQRCREPVGCAHRQACRVLRPRAGGAATYAVGRRAPGRLLFGRAPPVTRECRRLRTAGPPPCRCRASRRSRGRRSGCRGPRRGCGPGGRCSGRPGCRRRGPAWCPGSGTPGSG